MINNKKAFTLVELLISMGIMGLILTGVFLYLRSNLKIYSSGERKVSLQMELQKVMKFIYLELKSVGPIVYLDKRDNVVLDDEYNNDYKLSKIDLADFNKLGYQRLSFWKKDVFHLVSPQRVILYLDPKLGLVKKVVNVHGEENEVVISKYVKHLYFNTEREDKNLIKVLVELEKGGKKDSFSLVIRLDTDFLGVFK